MASSFQGTPIFIWADNVPIQADIDVTYRHMPYSDTTFIDIGGKNLKRITYTLLFNGPTAATDVLAFLQRRGQTGILVSDVDGTFNVLLEKCSRTGHGAQARGEGLVQCEFVVIGVTAPPAAIAGGSEGGA